MRRGEFENLENKIVLEIDYNQSKGQFRKIDCVRCRLSWKLQRKPQPESTERISLQSSNIFD